MNLASTLTPFFEVVIISIMINYILSFFWNTRSMDLMLGMLAFLIIFAISTLFHLPILQRLMVMLANIAAFAILIIFQPELRMALSKMGLKGRRYKEISEFDRFLEHLATSVYKMAERRTGAIIALENEDSLEEYASKGVVLNANFSSELLETIFSTSTPLHDGAVILRDQTLLGASCILPLAEDSAQIAKSFGTRHRAALGLSQLSDALMIVISEETGKVSIARDGIMTSGVKIDRFLGIVRSIFNPPVKEKREPRFTFKEWVRS